ncbi:MAG TPA: class I SAM-dependent methyltransferase [Phycisphaerales bacterium]|nr:class I SAM-dependent methyltransferase [Phycisphaerales bacterium]
MPTTATPAPAATTFTFQSSTDPLLRAQPWRLTTSLIAHADQKPRERVLLYAMVFALAPQRCLEIGVRWGGGSRIIHAALSDLSHGHLVSIDPEPALEFDWAEIADRATLIVGRSPDDIPRCVQAAGGAFDFVFIDGLHTQDAVHQDLRAVADATTPGATILLHDAYHAPVQRGIDAALTEGLPFMNCGMLATTRNEGVRVETGRPLTFGGVRMLRRM